MQNVPCNYLGQSYAWCVDIIATGDPGIQKNRSTVKMYILHLSAFCIYNIVS